MQVMTTRQDVSFANPSTTASVPFFFLYKCALLATGLVPGFMIFNLLISCLLEGRYGTQLVWWIGGYMGCALLVALIARFVLGHPRESSLLRRCCFVCLLALLLPGTLACVAWPQNSIEWSYMGGVAVLSMHVPLLFLWFAGHRVHEKKTPPMPALPASRCQIAGNSLFGCSFIAVSPWVGVAYMALVMRAANCNFTGIAEFVLSLLLYLVPGWLAAAVVVTLILWLVRMSRKWWWAMLTFLSCGVWGVAQVCCGGIAGLCSLGAVWALLPSVYVAQCVRSRREEKPGESAVPSVYGDAVRAVLPVTGVAVFAPIVCFCSSRECDVAMLLFGVGGAVLALLYAVFLGIWARFSRVESPLRRILFVLLACWLPAFPVFSMSMSSTGTEFLAFGPGLLPIVLLFLVLQSRRGIQHHDTE